MVLRLLFATTLLALAGCAREPALPPMYEIEGAVFFQGEPAHKAHVVFHPEVDGERLAPSYVARVDEQGKFRLETGLPEGAYGITIVRLKKSDKGIEQNIYPPRYADPSTSGLQLTVKPEVNRIDPIEVTP